jgi:hypothetical protein
MFLGQVLDQGGLGTKGGGGHTSQELGTAEQAGGDGAAGGVGARSRRKKRKSSVTTIASTFKVFGF